MEIRVIDERNLHEVEDTPTFRVLDWSNPNESGIGTTTTAFEITNANLWEALEWARTDRPNKPIFSEIYVTIDTDRTNEYLIGSLLGTLEWDRSGGNVRVSQGLVLGYANGPTR